MQPRENSKRIPPLRWRRLATLGDVQRALRSVILRVNAKRLDIDTGRVLGQLLRTQAEVIELGRERRIQQMAAGHAPSSEAGADDDRSTEELISIVQAGSNAPDTEH